MQNLCLHTHNFFCDGKSGIEDMVESAVSKGVSQIGISSHAPLKFFNKWSMELSSMDDYKKIVRETKNKYASQIDVFLSLEMDYIPGLSYDFDFFREKLNLDYSIGSIHLVLNQENRKIWFIDGDKSASIKNMNDVFGGDAQKAIRAYFQQTREMLHTQKPDIIAHADKAIMNIAHLIDTNSQWFQNEILETLDLIKQLDVIVEANTRGLYKGKWHDTFPGKAVLEKCYEMDIPVLISSDAHNTTELTLEYDTTRAMLKNTGFRFQKKKTNDGWQNIPL